MQIWNLFPGPFENVFWLQMFAQVFTFQVASVKSSVTFFLVFSGTRVLSFDVLNFDFFVESEGQFGFQDFLLEMPVEGLFAGMLAGVAQQIFDVQLGSTNCVIEARKVFRFRWRFPQFTFLTIDYFVFPTQIAWPTKSKQPEKTPPAKSPNPQIPNHISCFADRDYKSSFQLDWAQSYLILGEE